MNLQNYLKYLEHFSLLTVGENKSPNFSWKANQKVKLTPEEFTKRFNHKNDSHYKSKNGTDEILRATQNVGIICGFEDLEVVDVDLKVFSTTKEKVDFWNELLSLLRNAIFDFDEKFVIYKTQNAGYHILYKSKRVGKNVKLAILKGHKEACIETRATGGYVFMYPDNKISKNSYFDVQYISDADREELLRICRSYNYIEPIKQTIEPKLKKQYNDNSKTPWDDFNEQNTVWSVISDGFDVIRDTPTRTFIKRHGGSSVHSGIIYKNENLLWLFSTGTIYPHEKQINPYIAYTWKYHNGDFSASAKDLYDQGFGDRFEIKPPTIDLKEEENSFNINNDLNNFPLDVFPEPYQNYILENNRTLGNNIDFMCGSLLWLFSIIIGNFCQIKIKNQFRQSPILWLAIVGKPGTGKTPAINDIINPLKKLNGRAIIKYNQELEEFNNYEKLTKKEKEQQVEVKKPRKEQFIVQDATVEALLQLHSENDVSIGVLRDELTGWIKDMNKYREGSDLEMWLEFWNGGSGATNRVTRATNYVEKTFISVLGGIQPRVLDELHSESNKENGFSDRLLLVYPEHEVSDFNFSEIPIETVKWYNNKIQNIFNEIRSRVVRDNSNGFVVRHDVGLTDKAKEAVSKHINDFRSRLKSDNENEYVKSIYPKQEVYLYRFALILNVMDYFENRSVDFDMIDADKINKAKQICEYFINMAKKVKYSSVKNNEIKAILSQNKGSNNLQKFKELMKRNKNFDVKEVADLMGVSIQSVYKYKKQVERL